ncbi:hypothetical protein GC170_08905 [bacterium]|nr:hypothetical protein [bacterium]
MQLESRCLLAAPGDLVPGTLYTDAAWYDSNGDTVEVQVIGGPGGFTIALEGGAVNHADADLINLIGLSADSSLIITVTPNELDIAAGAPFNHMFTSGYTNVRQIAAVADPDHPAAPMTQLNGIQMSAAVVSRIELPAVTIGNVSLDTGMAPFVDRVNTTTINQTLESGMYLPVTGLIGMGNLFAKNVDSIVIDGVISAKTGNPNDPAQTNNFNGVIDVSGSIGSIVGLRSGLNGSIRASSIGRVNVAAIAGEIATQSDLTIALPLAFAGFVNVGGHLNAGFPIADGKKMTGQITAGGGISGFEPSETDPLQIPDGFAGVIIDTSSTKGIANIAINGVAAMRLISASSIGDITANEFTKAFIAEAGTSIGNLESYIADLAGSIRAGTDIGNIKSALGIKADLIAGRNIGFLTGVTGGIGSKFILAGGDLAGIDVVQIDPAQTAITIAGDLGDVHVRSGGWNALTKARKIGNITLDDGSLIGANFVSATSIGNVYVSRASQPSIQGGSLIAGGDIGFVECYVQIGTCMYGNLIQAGGRIAGVKAVSYGNMAIPPLPPSPDPPPIVGTSFGMTGVQIIGGSVGSVVGISYMGAGIVDTLITSSSWDIDSVSGFGNVNGMTNVKVIAAENIGLIEGRVWAAGDAISMSLISTDYGNVGSVIAEAGPAGGTAINNTIFDVAGTIGTIAAFTHADGIALVTADAGGYGDITVMVKTTEMGSGISGSKFKSYTGGFGDINVDSKSLAGSAIDTSTFDSAAGIEKVIVRSYAGPAITGGTFSAVGDIGQVWGESRKSGPGLDKSKFASKTGSIGKAGGITAIAGGGDPIADALTGSEFRAAVDIGPITATAAGGGAITSSAFLADSDNDNIGRFDSIIARANGRNLTLSSGIVGSTFVGTAFGAIDVAVTTVEGGSGIVSSMFTARTANYDGVGDFDNKGLIGNITVSNASMTGNGNGIETSEFHAGSAGSIGNVRVTVDLGVAIFNSTFDATVSDLDQNLFTSTIGTISVLTSRSTEFTKNVAGIEMSTFKSNAGIAAIVVNTVGTGINGSTFNADADHGLLGDIPGPLGDIRVSVPGRNASGVVMSTFAGSSIGNIVVKLEANATTAMDAIAGSTFTALVSSIGDITVVDAGLGYAIADSTFVAVHAIGNINVTGDIINTQFIVTNSTIGNVYVQGKLDQSLSMQAEYFGNITFEMLAAARVTLALPKVITMGNLTVTATGSLLANLALTATPLVQAGNVFVDGQLALANSLTSVTNLGSFQVGSLAATSGNIGLTIGSTSTTSQIGAIVIGQAPTGKAQHTFRFGAFGGNPDAVVGSASGNAKPGQGALIGNVRFILNQGAKTAATQTKKPATKLAKAVVKTLPRSAGKRK